MSPIRKGSGRKSKGTGCGFWCCLKSVVVIILSVPVVWFLLWVDDPRVTLERFDVVPNSTQNETELQIDIEVYNPNLFRGITHLGGWIEAYYYNGSYNYLFLIFTRMDTYQNIRKSMPYNMNQTLKAESFLWEEGGDKLRNHSAYFHMSFYLLVKYKILIWQTETKHRIWLDVDAKEFTPIENNPMRLSAPKATFNYITNYTRAVATNALASII